MAGNPVSSAVSVTVRLASRSAVAVPPLDTRSQPRPRSSRASSTMPVLSYTESRALMAAVGSFWRIEGSASTARMVSG